MTSLPTTSLPEMRAAIEQALAALSGTWRSSSDGRIQLIFGSKEARRAVLRDLKSHPLANTHVAALQAKGLFLSLSSYASHDGQILNAYNETGSLRAWAAVYAEAGRRLVLVCDDVESAALHDLSYLCRGINATVNDAIDGKPGILLILLGNAGAAHRQIATAWPDAEMGTQSYYLA